MISFRRPVQLRAAAAATLATFALAACGDDSPVTPAPTAPRGILVLDGFIQPGMTFLADTGTASTRVAFGPPTEFDAGGFTLERDTALAVSSRGAGDLLYILDVRAGTVRRVQLPARSNPGRARLLRGSNGQALIGVALRDSSTVALVSVPATGTPTITRIQGVGLCPTDVFQFDNATWVVDANANCRTNYAVQGDARLIRVPATGTARDTLVLPGARSSGVSATVMGDVAYVAAGGDANFSSFPYTLVASGMLTKVDLRGRRVLQQRQMPAGTYGASTKVGLDGFLYVSLYENLVAFSSKVLKLRTDDLTFQGGASALAPWLPLRTPAGDAVACSAAQADALGRVHCIVNGAGSATSLLVFDPSFREIRRVPAGQGGVDLALR
jgi:hypothetical protein